MTDLQDLQALRRERWRQTAATRLTGSDAAPEMIDRMGVVTLYPASPEIPNLFHAYMGDPDAKTDSKWDSPAGEVYGWRWDLGHKEAAFYGALVRRRPTWVAWSLLPAVLRLRGEQRDPDDLYSAGELSNDARRIAAALAEAGGTLSTAELRRRAGFPTGNPQRAAYLKAVEELEARLLVAKVFSGQEGDTEAYHALVPVRYAEHIRAAQPLTREQAVDRLLHAYLPHAVYALPATLAKHLGLPPCALIAGLNRLVAADRAEQTTIPGIKEPVYVWACAHRGSVER